MRGLLFVLMFFLPVLANSQMKLVDGDWFSSEGGKTAFVAEERKDSKLNLFGVTCVNGYIFPFFETYNPVGLPGSRGVFGSMLGDGFIFSLKYKLVKGSQKYGVLYVDMSSKDSPMVKRLSGLETMVFGVKSDDDLYQHDGINVSLVGFEKAYHEVYKRCR